MPPEHPKVFISYSHDSPEHEQRVLALAERLRNDGVDAQIDQYVAGTPPETWPRWMLDRLEWADFVLVISTKTYYRRFRGHETGGTGKGADWEGNLITLELYNSKSTTTKFAPVIFDPQDAPFIPEPIAGHTRYVLDSEGNYAKLYAFLTHQLGTEQSNLGPIKTLARRQVNPLRFDDLSAPNPASGASETGIALSQSDKRSLSVQVLSRSLPDVCANKILGRLLFRSLTTGLSWGWRDRRDETLRALECYCADDGVSGFETLLKTQSHSPQEQQHYRRLYDILPGALFWLTVIASYEAENIDWPQVKADIDWQKQSRPLSIKSAREGWQKFKESSDANDLVCAMRNLLDGQRERPEIIERSRAAFDQDTARLFSLL